MTISGGNPIVVSIFYFLAQILGGIVGAAFALVCINILFYNEMWTIDCRAIVKTCLMV